MEAPFYFDFVVESNDSGFINVTVGSESANFLSNTNSSHFLNGLEIFEMQNKSSIIPPHDKPKKKKKKMC